VGAYSWILTLLCPALMLVLTFMLGSRCSWLIDSLVDTDAALPGLDAGFDVHVGLQGVLVDLLKDADNGLTGSGSGHSNSFLSEWREWVPTRGY